MGPARSESAWLDVAGARLHTERAGSGDPVLLLHGGGSTLDVLRPQAEALAEHHTVHAYERPGHGRTPDTPGPYGYAAWTAQAVAVLDALGLDAVHVVGHSDGAIIGLLLALEHPARVRSLVAISANLDPSGFGLDPEELAAAVAEAGDPSGDEDVLAKLRRVWLTEPHIDPARLGAIAVPVVVVAGDRDSIRPDHTRLIAASIPGARLELLGDASHGLVEEHPEVVTGLLVDVLTTPRSPTASPLVMTTRGGWGRTAPA